MMFHQLGANEGEEVPSLPPGFRFHPTDEELVSYYLKQKVLNSKFVFQAIGEVDFNKCEPWDLPAQAKLGEDRLFYFFSLRDRKYPTGMRTNRATEAGYWKATGKDREVMSSSTERLVGMKKTLVFYTGRAPKGVKTNWIMHEYRLEEESTSHHQEWVVCRIFEKSSPNKSMPAESHDNTSFNTQYSNDLEACSSLPALLTLEPPSPTSGRWNSMYPGLSQISEPQTQGYLHVASIPGQETILRRSNNIMTGRRENLQYGDSLQTMLSGWDMYSPEWTGDVGGSR